MLVFHDCYNTLSKFRVLKQHKFINLQFCSLGIQNGTQCAKIKVLAGLHFFCIIAPWGNLFSCPLQHLEEPCIPLLAATSSIFKVSNSQAQSFQHYITLHSSSTSLFQFIDPCDCIGPTLIIQNNLPILL